MAGRSTANLLTRATTIVAGLFFLTSIVLSIMSGGAGSGRSILENVAEPVPTLPSGSTEAVPGLGGQGVGSGTTSENPAATSEEVPSDAGVPLDE
jgi:preprotein translocase subunit SecG